MTLALALLSLAPPLVARAHPTIDAAADALRRAEYDAALALLDRAEAGDDLSREDAIALLLLRARVHHAAGRSDDVEVEVFRLTRLAPELTPGPEIPPAIARQIEAAREGAQAPAARAEARRTSSGVEVEVSVRSDVAGLARGFRVHGRADGEPWRTAERARLSIPAAPDRAVEYWAEVLGPGGAPIARSGSAAEPTRVPPLDANDAPDDGLPWWPFVVGAGVVAVGVVVALILAFTIPTDDTDLVFPAPQPLRF